VSGWLLPEVSADDAALGIAVHFSETGALVSVHAEDCAVTDVGERCSCVPERYIVPPRGQA